MAGNAENATDSADVRVSENSTVKEMRCVTLTGFGGRKMVKVVKKPEVAPIEGEILIKVKFCGISFTDIMVRQGAVDSPPKTPFTLGFECSGEVLAVGESVSRFAIGDRVLAVTDYGAWSEQITVSEQYVYKMPTNMTFEDGAALFMNYVTAYVILFDIGNLRPSQSVLVHSAGGGVGTAFTQLCRAVDKTLVFGTASSSKHETLKKNVDHLFDHSDSYTQEIRKISPDGVDIVLDCLCGEDTNKGINLLKPLGKYILYGSSNVVTGETKSFFSFAKSWWQMEKISPIKLFDENKSISGFHLRQLLFKQNGHEYIRKTVDSLFTLYNQGKIKPVIDSIWAFEDIGEAMQTIHDRKNIGKLLLDPEMQPKRKPEGNQCNDENNQEQQSDEGKEGKK